MSEEIEPSQAKVEALAKEFLAKVMEHCSAAQVFITMDADNGKVSMVYHHGKGNWYERFGAVHSWCSHQDFGDPPEGL